MQRNVFMSKDTESSKQELLIPNIDNTTQPCISEFVTFIPKQAVNNDERNSCTLLKTRAWTSIMF